jgi:hypothetical protein
MITIISYPNNNIDEEIEVSTSIQSSEMIQNINIDIADAGNDEYIEVTYNEETITLLITDECRYTPIDIAFQNKEGAVTILPFFKAKTESMDVTRSNYEGNFGQPSEGNHQYIDYNVQGKSKFKISSGFVNEQMNEIFKQLILSERVWIVDNLVPIKVSMSSIEYKTRQKDRLINYEFDFEYAFNEINNV